MEAAILLGTHRKNSVCASLEMKKQPPQNLINLQPWKGPTKIHGHGHRVALHQSIDTEIQSQRALGARRQLCASAV